MFEEDDDIYRPEVKAFERVANNVLMNGCLIEGDQAVRGFLTPEERFKVRTNAVAYAAGFDEKMMENLFSKIALWSKIKDINPTAFVLGYIASCAGKGLTKKGVEDAKKISKENFPGVVDVFSIIRYGRKWEILTKK